MATLFREYPLLNTPSMVLVILRQAAERGAATLADCVDALNARLDQADERPPFTREDVESRLAMLVRYLAEAKLLTVAPDGRFTATARGRAALVDHPQGFDVADLMAYPEFARHIRGLELRRNGMDPRAGGYDAGFYAYWTGQIPADNPYSADSADHLAWENGWSEALDEDFRWNGPHAAEKLR